jgi:hypothetical protein
VQRIYLYQYSETTQQLQEVNEYAFEYLLDLFTEITIDSETFKPIDKLFDGFEIKMYKLK